MAIWGILGGLPSIGLTQQNQMPAAGFEEPDNYIVDPIKCLGVTSLTLVEKECIQDEKMNENDRQQTRSIDRWMRGGMLTVATIMNQVRRVGGMVESTQSLVEQIKKSSAGFRDKRESISAYRIASASDAIDAVSNSLLAAGNALIENPGNRYFVVEASMQRSLQEASDGDVAAAQLSERILAIQYRLAKASDSTGRGGGLSGVRSVGGAWRDTLPQDFSCPPPPLGQPASFVDGCMKAYGGASEYTSSEEALPRLAMARGYNTAEPAATSVRKTEAATVDKTNCPATGSDDLSFDPKVLLERSITTFKGAQTAIQGAIVNTGLAEKQAEAFRQLELFAAMTRNQLMRRQSLMGW